MIRELSEFSRLDAAPANWEPVDLNEIADEVRISLRPMLVQKNALVTIGPLPIIDAKPGQMTQLFAHLVANALQSSRPDVQPAITILADKLSAAEVSLYAELDLIRPYCRLRFEDNGIGIEPNQLHRIFPLISPYFERIDHRELISISGPPDPSFAREIGAPWFVRLIMRLLSSGVTRKAKRAGVDFSFLFMRAESEQLSQLTRLVEAGIIKPVVDKVLRLQQE